MPELKVTNMAKFYSLVILCDKPMHGYDLIKIAGEKLGKKISPGQMYPFLAKLEKISYVKVKSEGERDKKVYALTPKGKKFCMQMLHKFGDLVELAIEPNLSKCAHCGCEVFKGGHTEKIRGKELTFCCIHCAATFKEHGH
ncbi:MAG: PadR family transcriptional regulator [archaeon]|nr:PadR family transcriptional regulator [archaeon]